MKQDANYRPDEFLASGDVVGFNAQPPQDGEISIKEAYVELAVPLLKDLPAVHKLGLELGYRYSDHNLAGTYDTYKAALNWDPLETVRLRGSYQPGAFVPRRSTNCSCRHRRISRAPRIRATPPQRASPEQQQLCIAQGIPASVVADVPSGPTRRCARLRVVTRTSIRSPRTRTRTVSCGNRRSPIRRSGRQSITGSTRSRTRLEPWRQDSSIGRVLQRHWRQPDVRPEQSVVPAVHIAIRRPRLTDVQENFQNLGKLKAKGVDLQLDYGQPLGDRWGQAGYQPARHEAHRLGFPEDSVSPFGHFRREGHPRTG